MDEGQSIAILAVDDEPGVLSIVRRCLNDPRIVLTEATSGKEALERNGPGIDLLITDLLMPEMPGDELAERARVRQPGLPVLYLTGHADGLFRGGKPLEPGNAYLDKPFTREGLRQAVALLLFDSTTLTAAPVGAD